MAEALPMRIASINGAVVVEALLDRSCIAEKGAMRDYSRREISKTALVKYRLVVVGLAPNDLGARRGLAYANGAAPCCFLCRALA